MNDDKLNSIETMLSHHDIKIQDLSEMLNLQWKEIERLKLQLSKAYDKISDIEATSEGDSKTQSVSEIAASEKPPHY